MNICIDSDKPLLWKISKEKKRRGVECWNLIFGKPKLWFAVTKEEHKTDPASADLTTVYTARWKTLSVWIENPAPDQARFDRMRSDPDLRYNAYMNHYWFNTEKDAKIAVERFMIELGTIGDRIKADREKWG